VSLWRHPERGVLALVSNLGREAATVRAQFDLAALGIAGVSAEDAITGETLAMENGALALALPAEDWRLVRLR